MLLLLGGDFIRKLTYTNSVNGLSAEFSSESSTMHLKLSEFDGSSVGAVTVNYTPVEFDGQKTISANLAPRSIIVPVEFSALENGKRSRAGALAVWERLLKVFVPLHEGWLVWTDGTNSRRIRCRTAETPKLTQILPFLFSAQFTLVADYPYWESVEEHSVEVVSSAESVTVTNSCGLEVPFCVDVDGSDNLPLIYSMTAEKGIAFAISPGASCVVDTKECTVTLADGSFANHLLTVQSEFFRLLPGKNVLKVLSAATGGSSAVIRWRDLYLGVE